MNSTEPTDCYQRRLSMTYEDDKDRFSRPRSSRLDHIDEWEATPRRHSLSCPNGMAHVVKNSTSFGDVPVSKGWKAFDVMVNNVQAEGDSYALQEEEFQTIDCSYRSALYKLCKTLDEFLETEIKFSVDVNNLKTALHELKYSTLCGARELVSSVPYVGITLSCESIKSTSNLMVTLFTETSHGVKINLDSDIKAVGGFEDFKDSFQACFNHCDTIFNALKRCSLFFPMFASFIIHHDGLSDLYREKVLQDEEFRLYMYRIEALVGESLQSLLIKPVQRLPRYVLLCQRIHSIISKLHTDMKQRSVHFDMINDIFERSEMNRQCMAEFTSKCNEAVRIHEENVQMHRVHKAFEEGGSDNLVNDFISLKRRMFREGRLMRHHKHNGMKEHVFQIFSDALLSSSAVGSSLHLEHSIPLTKNSNTICYPIPPMFGPSESAWFVISSKKIMFCRSKSVESRDKWVEDLTSCLLANRAEADMFLVRKQMALINGAIISHINELWRRDSNLEDVRSTDAADRENDLSSIYIQATWWRLLQLLQSYEDGAHSASRGLQRVVDAHAEEVTNRVLRFAFGVDDNSKKPQEAVSEKEKLISFLLNGQPHYFISSMIFFEASDYDACESLDQGVRPLMLRVFLFHDVLLACYFQNLATPLRYAFHISMSHLRSYDHTSGPTAISLVDASIKETSSRLFLKSHSRRRREKILFAPTLSIKNDWFALLLQVAKAYRVMNECQDHSISDLRSHGVPLPLLRIRVNDETKVWEYETEKHLSPNTRANS